MTHPGSIINPHHLDCQGMVTWFYKILPWDFAGAGREESCLMDYQPRGDWDKVPWRKPPCCQKEHNNQRQTDRQDTESPSGIWARSRSCAHLKALAHSDSSASAAWDQLPTSNPAAFFFPNRAFSSRHNPKVQESSGSQGQPSVSKGREWVDKRSASPACTEGFWLLQGPCQEPSCPRE